MKKQAQLDAEGHRRFGILDSISYAAGDFGCNMSFALKSTLAIFWTQFMGLEIWYSLLLIIVQVWDAINDPIIGSMIDADKHKYKRNKFLTYIRAGSLGLLVAGANQTMEVAANMRYLVAALYLFSAVMQFIGLALIYNLDKKTLAQMNEELKLRKSQG